MGNKTVVPFARTAYVPPPEPDPSPSSLHDALFRLEKTVVEIEGRLRRVENGHASLRRRYTRDHDGAAS